jgi:hypothetical protein
VDVELAPAAKPAVGLSVSAAVVALAKSAEAQTWVEQNFRTPRRSGRSATVDDRKKDRYSSAFPRIRPNCLRFYNIAYREFIL